jgi:hypothetical protein
VSVILAIREAESRRITDRDKPGEIDPISKISNTKKGSQWLSSNPSTAKTKTKKPKLVL